MNNIYRSPYEAYPFLADGIEDLRCDFEILTDKIASEIGLLASLCSEEDLKVEILKVDELVYHLNPTLRTKMTVTKEEILWLHERFSSHREATLHRCEKFVLPQGSKRGCIAHVIRTDCKQLVRMIYRHIHQGHTVEDSVLDFSNLLSNYFFVLSMLFNEIDEVDEVEFLSRNYR